MSKIIRFKALPKVTLNNRFLLIKNENLPENYTIEKISYKNDEIEKYDVIFFHRLMRKNYGEPSEIDYKIEKIKNGKNIGIGKEWRYFVLTKYGGIILIGTENIATKIMICHVHSEGKNYCTKRNSKEGEIFINYLLDEANRLKGQLLNPLKEFEKGEGIQLYLLNNVYLFNYGSAELMFEYAQGNELEIRSEFLKYDWREDIGQEKKAYTEKYQLGVILFT